MAIKVYFRCINLQMIKAEREKKLFLSQFNAKPAGKTLSNNQQFSIFTRHGQFPLAKLSKSFLLLLLPLVVRCFGKALHCLFELISLEHFVNLMPPTMT